MEVLRIRVRFHESLHGLDDLELAVGLDFADVDRLPGVLVGLVHHLFAAGRREFEPVDRLADLVDVERVGLFAGHGPDFDAVVGRLDRVVGDASDAGVRQIGALDVIDEGDIRIVLDLDLLAPAAGRRQRGSEHAPHIVGRRQDGDLAARRVGRRLLSVACMAQSGQAQARA